MLAILISVFACTPTAVWDGDGPIWCAEGPKVRLAAIAAREIVIQSDKEGVSDEIVDADEVVLIGRVVFIGRRM